MLKGSVVWDFCEGSFQWRDCPVISFVPCCCLGCRCSGWSSSSPLGPWGQASHSKGDSGKWGRRHLSLWSLKGVPYRSRTAYFWVSFRWKKNKFLMCSSYCCFFSFKENPFYLFIYLFSAVLGLHCCMWASLWRVGATLHCGAWTSHFGGFSCCGAWALGAQVSITAAPGLSRCGVWV